MNTKLNNSNANLRVCYFMGNISSHCSHAAPLYQELGGEFIALSDKTADEINAMGFPSKCIDDRPDLHLNFDRKIKKTVKYIEQHFDVVVFYELFTFSFWSYIKKTPTVFLSHGNMLKKFMFKDRIEALKKYDYLAALSPFLKDKFIHEYSIKPAKLIDVGIARNDQVVQFKGTTTHTPKFMEQVNLDFSKPFVSYIPTWWGITTVDNIGIEFVKNFPSQYNLLLRLHPQTPTAIVDAYSEIVQNNANMKMVESLPLEDQMASTDLLIADLSSIVLEWILIDKPLIFLHQKNDDYRSGLESIKEVIQYCHAICEDTVDNTHRVIDEAFNKGISEDAWGLVKHRAFYGFDGDSTQGIVSAIDHIARK